MEEFKNFVKHKNDESKKPTKSLSQILFLEKKSGLNTKKVYENFQNKIDKIKNFLNFLNKERKKIKFYCIWCGSKRKYFLNYLNINSNHIKYVVDRNPIKIGKFLPEVKFKSKVRVLYQKLNLIIY